MVYLGYFAVSFQPVGTVPRMAIVLDTTQDKTAFNFAAAVRRELDWMANPDLGIIALSMQVRNEIEDSLQSAAHGDTQYWTRQRRVLSYNQWYTGDSLNGVWSTNGVRGGCGLDAQFTLPVDSFTALSRGHTYAIVPGNARFAAIDLNTQTTTMVDAVKELSGQYYCIFMSRLPDFWNKTVKGYFDTDFVLFVGANATVFVETEIVGERTNVVKKAESNSIKMRSPRFIRTIGEENAGAPGCFDIRGRALIRGEKIQVIIRQERW
jgi:hypothetical protein